MTLWDIEGQCVPASMCCSKTRCFRRIVFFLKKEYMNWKVDSVDKGDTEKTTFAKHGKTAVIQYIILIFLKRVSKWIYRVLSTFGSDFPVFFKSGNLCQRLSTPLLLWECLKVRELCFVNTVNTEMCAYYFLKIHLQERYHFDSPKRKL